MAATGICGTDIHIVDDEFRSWPPVVMGHEVCGTVREVHDDDDRSWVGQRVVCETYFSTDETCSYCRAGQRNLCLNRRSIGSAVDGGFAPRLLIPARNLHAVPEWLDSAPASLAEPLACVCNCLLDPPIVSGGDAVLVVGPGPVGLLAAQVARVCGGVATILGTSRDAARLGAASSLGFDARSAVPDADELFDVVVDCSGNEAGITTAITCTRRGGRYVQVGLAGRPVTVPLDEICFRELTVTSGNASTATSWWRALRLIEQREVDLPPLVSDVLPLDRWKDAFAATRAGSGIKFVLDPRRAVSAPSSSATASP